jgi:hypothetical protein
MTAEISSPRPLPPPTQLVRPNAAAEQPLKLLQPLDDLLAVGESAKAEVVALKELVQSFQLVLKLTLANGQQSTLQASSNQPLAQGTALIVTALAQNRLGITLATPQKPLQSLDLAQLPAGTLLQAKVISSEALRPNSAQQNLYKVVISLLNSSLAGTKLSLETPLNLPSGSLLSAQVKDAQALSFLPLSSRLDQLALGQQLQTQQERQGSLEALVKNLQGLTASDSAKDAALPAELRASIDKLLGALPDMAQMRSAKGVAQALSDSGVFLEAKLLDGKQAALPRDLKANLLRIVEQLLPAAPTATSTALLASTNQGSLALALPLFVRNLLGNLGQAGARQQAGSFPLPTRILQNLEDQSDLGSLLRLAAAAVSRLQTHQLSSLAQSQMGPDGNLLNTWQLEIPMRNQQELIPLQAKIQREDRPKKSAKEPGETLWRIELAFDLAPLGPLQVQAQLTRGSVSSQLWAERSSTADLIERELGHLRERLTNAGLNVTELACKQGTPPQGQRTNLEQRWVDETA